MLDTDKTLQHSLTSPDDNETEEIIKFCFSAQTMNESDRVLILVQEQKNCLEAQKSDFECKLSKVESLLTQEEELWTEVEDYVQNKQSQFSSFLTELEDLEFKIEEQKIKSGEGERTENQADQLITGFQSELEMLLKKYKFKKCFYWE